MYDLFCHVASVHDERVSSRKYHEIHSTLHGRSIDTDLPVVWPRNKPGPNWIQAPAACDHTQTEAHRL